MLGRARNAARTLSNGAEISDIALEHGYSDQSHMTREFVRWFGQTPDKIRNSPASLYELSQAGLGNWGG